MYSKLEKPSVYIGISPKKQSLRIGEFRTFLYIYACARHFHMPVYIRCDDTNPESRNEQNLWIIVNEMKRFGLTFFDTELHYWNDSILYQSKNTKLYREYLSVLEKKGLLSELDGLVSLDFNKAINTISDNINFGKDILRRSTSFDLKKSGYSYIPIYSKTEDKFLFHLPCVVDEYLMNVKIAIRGEYQISLMPIHNVLRYLLGFSQIDYLHTPLLLLPESNKRINSEEYSLKEFLKKYPTQEIVSYLLKSGYRKDYKGLLALDDFARDFEIEQIKKVSNRFNSEDI